MSSQLDRVFSYGKAGSQYFGYRDFTEALCRFDPEPGKETPDRAPRDSDLAKWLDANSGVFGSNDPWPVVVGYYLKMCTLNDATVQRLLSGLDTQVFAAALQKLYDRSDRAGAIGLAEFWLLPHRRTWDRLAGPLLNHSDARLRRYGAIALRRHEQRSLVVSDADREAAVRDEALRVLIEGIDSRGGRDPGERVVPPTTLGVARWRRTMAWLTGRIHAWDAGHWLRVAGFAGSGVVGLLLLTYCLLFRDQERQFKASRLEPVGAVAVSAGVVGVPER